MAEVGKEIFQGRKEEYQIYFLTSRIQKFYFYIFILKERIVIFYIELLCMICINMHCYRSCDTPSVAYVKLFLIKKDSFNSLLRSV